MDAVYLPGNSTAEVRQVPVPTPGPGEMLLRIGASGICGSDINYIYREHKTHRGVDGPAYRGVIAGHEPCGEVVALGEGCWKFRPGDRVVVYHITGCGRCQNCRAGYFISCSDEERRLAYGWQRDGGHAEYMIADESTCIKLADGFSFLDGALIACGFGTAYESLKRAGVSGRDDVLIVGLGPVGLAAAMISRGLGARRIFGIERNAARIEAVQKMNLFDAIFNGSEEGDNSIQGVTAGRGCSVAVDCSGSAGGRRVAIENVAEWGRVGLVGEGGTLETEVSDSLLHKQVTIYASWVTSLQNMEELIHLLAAWKMHPDMIVSHALPFSQADEAYRLVSSGEAVKVCLVPGEGEGQ